MTQTQPKTPIYCDMDGVLADFMGAPNAMARFERERGFFATLKPFKKNLEAVRNALAHGEIVYIISAAPNAQADHDKLVWLARFLPEMPADRIILMRNGQNKAEFMKTAHGILLDDYGRNCREWLEAVPQNRAVKIKQDGDIATALIATKYLSDRLLNAD